MIRKLLLLTTITLSLTMTISCSSVSEKTDHQQADQNESAPTDHNRNNRHYALSKTAHILLTSESGAKMAAMANASFTENPIAGTQIVVNPEKVKQQILGIGTSFTESSAFVLAHLNQQDRTAVMHKLYANSGANFSLTRTHIGSTDFSVEGKYSYAEAKDATLRNFDISPDSQGFSTTTYPHIKDTSFDLIPMIKQAIAIKQNQADKHLKIIASAWTAPPWMKDINTWFIRGSEANNWQGTGGALKPQYVSTYADYLIKYLEAYQKKGIDIWAITPVNEPNGNGGNWESMHFSAESQNDFIKKHLGPKIQASKSPHTKILIYDQNRDHLEHWANVIFSDPETTPYVYGVAVHWYSSTNKVYEEALQRVHKQFPNFSIIHTEGTIDDLGKPAPGGILDPERFQEKGWFDNDTFWWNKNATDWAYTATWAPNSHEHPIYTPVHRYARDIIVGLNNWMEGWVDWNAVLDHRGGPNHVGNFCGAPIMIHTETGQIYYTPIYDVLAQFSKTIRPGDHAIQTNKVLDNLEHDALHASASINGDNLLSVQLLNTTKQPIIYSLVIGAQNAKITIPANAIQTVQIQL